MSAARVRGYLATATSAGREGRDDDARAALRLAAAAAEPLPAGAPEHADVAIAQAELAQRSGDRPGAAAAMARACQLDRAVHRVDGVAVIRRLRAALAADAAGDRAGAKQLADEAVLLGDRLGDDLAAEARAVRARLDGSVPPPPVPTAAATKSTEPATPPATVEEILAELDGLVGLASVKEEIRRLIALAQVGSARKAAGLPVGERTRHLAMVGSPGTGKTTVARILGRLYGALGVVGSGHLVEVTRADLVAGYVGQTAQRTNAVCDSALGGVLFVDEAYSLVSSGGGQDFGQEALAELVKRMEDDRGKLVVILAGYPAEMEALIAANTGLRSRLQGTLEFADYDETELGAIFDVIAERDHWTPTDAARAAAHAALAEMYAARGEDWANARTARTFFERCLAHHALRVTANGVVEGDELDTIEEADVLAARS